MCRKKKKNRVIRDKLVSTTSTPFAIDKSDKTHGRDALAPCVERVGTCGVVRRHDNVENESLQHNTEYLFTVEAVKNNVQLQSHPLRFRTPSKGKVPYHNTYTYIYISMFLLLSFLLRIIYIHIHIYIFFFFFKKKKEEETFTKADGTSKAFTPSTPQGLHIYISTNGKREQRYVCWNSAEKCLGDISYELVVDGNAPNKSDNSRPVRAVFEPLQEQTGTYNLCVRTVCEFNGVQYFSQPSAPIVVQSEAFVVIDDPNVLHVILLANEGSTHGQFLLRPIPNSLYKKKKYIYTYIWEINMDTTQLCELPFEPISVLGSKLAHSCLWDVQPFRRANYANVSFGVEWKEMKSDGTSKMMSKSVTPSLNTIAIGCRAFTIDITERPILNFGSKTYQQFLTGVLEYLYVNMNNRFSTSMALNIFFDFARHCKQRHVAKKALRKETVHYINQRLATEETISSWHQVEWMFLYAMRRESSSSTIQ
ncbi:hypothetical protein RFI_15501 [Reticulomyxa filosa]|uniref:Uncharacterized protein n=1 Tax=Reticulomyxa filosa TaxID=46433 RepID=X6N5X9_RETFI|nr:hypothetical protein RFI_15501 [Reticulomyxa filosa]|eukprot:ETO21700.1 hypothetical protein RFI_15501 [Reticulomyxa filosa]